MSERKEFAEKKHSKLEILGRKWGLQWVVVQKSLFHSILPPSSSWGDSSVFIAGWLILSYQSYCWQAGYGMGRSVIDLCWTCLETCLELSKSRYLISYVAIWWINSKVPEGSMNTSENNRVARESSRVIILKSRLNSTGHSACTREVRDVFQWLMTANVLLRSQRQRPSVILHKQ